MKFGNTWSKIPIEGLMFVLVAAFWGGSFIGIEVGLRDFPPLLFAALRYDVAGAVVLGYAAWRTDRWRPETPAGWGQVAVVGLFIIAGHHSLLYLGQQYVPGAVAAVVVSLSPVLTAVFASGLLAGTRLEATDVAGLALGFAGVFVIADPDPGHLLSADSVGVGLVFLASASFALGSVLTRPLDSGLPVQSLQGWGMVVGSATLHAASLARGESLAGVTWTPTAVGSLLYLTLVSGVVAFLLYFELLARIGPMELNLVGYLETVVATLLGWALLGHLVDSTTVAGFFAIFLGFAVVKRRTLATLLAGRTSVA